MNRSAIFLMNRAPYHGITITYRRTDMHTNLPQAVAAYFAAENSHAPDAVAACFTPTATVRDEGTTLVGKDAIRDWKRETSGKYNATIAPVSAEQDADQCTVQARVSGNFPGSPLNMHFQFTLAADHIAALEIKA